MIKGPLEALLRINRAFEKFPNTNLDVFACYIEFESFWYNDGTYYYTRAT